jgi:hypothetical protein
MEHQYTECPKKMYTHKVNIPYYNVYTSFWDTLYIVPSSALASYDSEVHIL